MPISRKTTFSTPRPVDGDLVAPTGTLSYIYIEEDSHNPHFNGGAFSDRVPVDYLLPPDKKLAEDYIAMILRESSSGAAKARKKAAEEAASVALKAKKGSVQ